MQLADQLGRRHFISIEGLRQAIAHLPGPEFGGHREGVLGCNEGFPDPVTN